MTARSQRDTTLFLFATLFCAISASLYAALEHLPMFLDGSSWYFTLLQYDKIARHPSYIRYFDGLIQLPALLAKLALGRAHIDVVIALLDFAYSLHPWVSLILTYWILKRRGRVELFIFALLSYATATQSTQAFAVGSAPDALTVFWPLFAFFITLGKKISKFEYAVTLALIAALAVTYEAAVILFAFLLGCAILERRGTTRAILAAGFAAGLSLTAYRILSPTAGHHRFFSESLREGLGPYQWVCLSVFVGLALALWLRRAHFLFAGLGVAALLTLRASHFDPVGMLFWSFSARTTALPFAAAFAGLAFFFRDPMARIGKSSIPLALGLALLISTLHQATITRVWRDRLHAVTKLVESKKGCNYAPKWAGSVAFDWALPYLSTLMQHSYELDAVYFPIPNKRTRDRDFCAEFMDGYLPDESGNQLVIPVLNFDYARARSKGIQTPKPDVVEGF